MFKPGETITDDSGAVIEGETDHPDFYVVMYENYDIVDGRRQSVMLDGNNVLTHKNIVGLARIKEQDIDVAIVISSSVDGAYFRGAVGSTLYVDTFKIICED